MRRAAALIREHADELAFLETLCAGLPIRHLRDRQVPRAAENFDFFADYIGLMAGESFEQQDGFLTTVTRRAGWRGSAGVTLECATGAGHHAGGLVHRLWQQLRTQAV